ncbi:MAG: homocysteine S-methyltransferase family protein [Bacteriodetes bacterium]|nr:homocysteine S-methyltransferase family protein [Bacteroidota bacterium]
MTNRFTEAMNSRVLLFDGATGTNLQQQNLTADDFGGKHLEGCNEYLCISKPDAVRRVHYDFLNAGADIIETNSFGSTSIVLAEYDIADMSYELSFLSAKIARQCADEFSTPERPRFVAGSMGPGTKLPSLGHITYQGIEESYYLAAKGLIDGGSDVLCIETCQDMLQVKAAITGAERAVAEWKESSTIDWRNHLIPFIVSVTIETTGTMLMGTEIASALTSLEPYQSVYVVGMNCATGPKEMEENVRYLCHNSPKPVFLMPNAGLPENVGGVAHYHLTPEEMLKWMQRYVTEFGVGIIGGCCGTTHQHIKALADWLAVHNNQAQRTWEYTPSVSSIYTSVAMRVDPAPLLVGERCNANGSKRFRELLLAEDYDSMVNMAKEQIREGAHVLDVCVAYVGRDEERDMIEVIKRFNTQVTLPLMIDSTEVNVIEVALQHYGGRAIINSINFEDGTEKADKILHLAKKYGASVVALSIDEEGQAYSFQKKIDIALRIRNHAVDVHGLREDDLIFDALTFPLGSGQEDLRDSGMNTINAIREIKRLMPRAKTILGLSNCSFGLKAHTRHVLNSVFLHYAIEAGLDMAIVHASKIMPLYKIDERGRELCRQLIFDERKWEDVAV